MPHNTPTPKTTADVAVENILAGKRADGTSGLGTDIPFTTDPMPRKAAASVIQDIIDALDGNLAEDHHTPLAVKLLIHFAENSLQTVERIASFDAETFTDSIREDPDLLMTNASVIDLLQGDGLQAERAIPRANETLAADVPGRAIIWSQGGYALLEATDPRHLQQDSAALRHCIGTIHNTDYRQQPGIDENHPDAIHGLHHWMRMKAGEIRMFSLTIDGRTVFTLEYDVSRRSIARIIGAGGEMPTKGMGLPFKALCNALGAIRGPFRLSGIPGLPKCPRGTVLLADGSHAPPSMHNIHDALAGTVAITRRDQLRVLGNTLITADITGLPQPILDSITTSSATLYSRASKVSLANLTHCGNLHFPEARAVALPRLHASGDNFFPSARDIVMPALAVSRDNIFESATTVALPSLLRSGNNSFPYAISVSLPSLGISRNNFFGKASEIALPALSLSGSNIFYGTTRVDLPSLRSSGHNHFVVAETVSIPNLRRSGDNDYLGAATISLPNLVTSGDNVFPSAKAVTLKALKSINGSQYEASRYLAALGRKRLLAEQPGC